jgi:hypothetical protein
MLCGNKSNKVFFLNNLQCGYSAKLQVSAPGGQTRSMMFLLIASGSTCVCGWKIGSNTYVQNALCIHTNNANINTARNRYIHTSRSDTFVITSTFSFRGSGSGSASALIGFFLCRNSDITMNTVHQLNQLCNNVPTPLIHPQSSDSV